MQRHIPNDKDTSKQDETLSCNKVTFGEVLAAVRWSRFIDFVLFIETNQHKSQKKAYPEAACLR